MLKLLKNYREWSLPEKIGIVTGVIGLIPILVSVQDWLVSVPGYTSIAINYGTSEMLVYGDVGESPETAVVIRGANSHEAGVVAEHKWLKRRYPAYEIKGQALFERPEHGSAKSRHPFKIRSEGVEVDVVAPADLPARRYDVITIQTWYFFNRDVYFDITSFFGKSSEPRDGLSEEEALWLTFDRLNKAKAEKSTSSK